MVIKPMLISHIPRRLPARLQANAWISAARLSHSASPTAVSHAEAHHPITQLTTRNGRISRERELILSVLSSVPSPRETRKFLNSVQASTTLRSQRQFEQDQAQLTVEQRTAQVRGMVHGELLSQQHKHEAVQVDKTVPRRLTAAVFVDGLNDRFAYERAGKLLAQIQRLGVTPVVLVARGEEEGDGYRGVIQRVHRLADAIEREAGKARPLNEGVFYSNPYTDSQLSVDPELIGSAIAQNQIPLISPLVADPQLRLQVLEPERAAPALAKALASSTSSYQAMSGTHGEFSLLLARLIFLGTHDGITTGVGGFQRFVNLEADYGPILGDCVEGQRDTLQLMRQCLGIFPPTAAGIVASVYSDPSLVMKGLISEKPVSAQHREANRKRQAQESTKTLVDGKSSAPSYKPLANYPFVKIGKDYLPGDASSAQSEQTAPVAPTQFTLLRHGFQIQSHTTLETCDVGRLGALLESSFKRPLKAQKYFERLAQRAQDGGIQIIVAGDYQGAVIVTNEPTGDGGYFAYLDKFAVAPSVQGTGMADILWAQLKKKSPKCMWRSRNDNGVNGWYFDRSHGHFRAQAAEGAMRWVFFWYQPEARDGGEAMTMEEIQAGIEAAGRIPASF